MRWFHGIFGKKSKFPQFLHRDMNSRKLCWVMQIPISHFSTKTQLTPDLVETILTKNISYYDDDFPSKRIRILVAVR